MSFTGVLRPGHIQIRVTDLARAVRHYADVIGLDEVLRAADGRVYFKAWDEFDHHSVILREADTPGMDFVGFKVTNDATLTDLGERVRRFGLAVEELPAGEMPATGRRLRFTCPTGHNAVERNVPAGKLIEAVVDNYTTHKHPKVKAWLARHPRWTFHFTPTSGSWLNAVENFFSTLTRKRIRRGSFHSIVDLQAAINRYLAEHNAAPTPFIWKASAASILAKLDKLPVPSV